MSPRVLSSFRVPAVSPSSQRNGQEFQPEALLKKKHLEFCQVGLFVCLCVYVCVVVLQKTEKTHG